MATTFRVVFSGELPAGTTENDLRIIMGDALGEYVAHRAYGDGAAYVANRYPDNTVYAGPDRERKIASVNLRCRIAETLRFTIDREERS